MEPIAVSVNDAARMLSLGRTSIYALINEGRLDTVKIGRRTLITTESIRRLVDDNDSAETENVR
jgi:excisionase family DNA binding protein